MSQQLSDLRRYVPRMTPSVLKKHISGRAHEQDEASLDQQVRKGLKPREAVSGTSICATLMLGWHAISLQLYKLKMQLLIKPVHHKEAVSTHLQKLDLELVFISCLLENLLLKKKKNQQ